jgi:hypothetical protein
MKVFEETKATSVGGLDWDEIGKEKVALRNQANDLIKNSPIFSIFGGLF